VQVVLERVNLQIGYFLGAILKAPFPAIEKPDPIPSAGTFARQRRTLASDESSREV
jgi:hypothetical protein